jgi:hypothetical protein
MMDFFFIDINKWLIFALFLISSYNYGGLFFYLTDKFKAADSFVSPSGGDSSGAARCDFNDTVKAVFRLGAGFVIFSTLVFAVSAAQAAYKLSMAAILLAPVIFQIFHIYIDRNDKTGNSKLHDNLFSIDFFSAVIKGASDYLRNIKSVPARILLIDFLAFALLLFAFISSVPPQYSWDAMAYQMEIPKRYAQNGGLYFIEDIHFAGHPKLLNMPYLFFIIFDEDTLCASFHFTFLLLCYLLTLNFDFRKYISAIYSRTASKIAALLIITHPQILILSSWAYIDLGLMFYFTAAALCLISSNYLLCALFLGAAMCAKYTGLLITAIFLPLLLYKMPGYIEERLKYSFRVILLAALIFSPYMAVNFYFTSNPFYPFLDSYIPFETKIYEYIDIYLATLDRVGGGRGIGDMLRYPYYSMINSRFHGNIYYDGLMGMTFFALIPFFLFALFKNNNAAADASVTVAGAQTVPDATENINALASIFGLYYLFVLKAQSTRFFIPAAPVFFIISVIGLKLAADMIFKLNARQTGRSLILFACFLAFNSLAAIGLFIASSPLGYLTGSESRESYLRRNLAPYHCAAEFNKICENNLEVNLMSVYEPRLYYLKSNYLWRDVFEASEIELAVHSCFDGLKEAKPSERRDYILNKLRAKKITHVLAKDRALELAARNFDDKSKESLFKSFLRKNTEITASGGGYNLYKILN